MRLLDWLHRRAVGRERERIRERLSIMFKYEYARALARQLGVDNSEDGD
jgi:hypothetical protein